MAQWKTGPTDLPQRSSGSTEHVLQDPGRFQGRGPNPGPLLHSHKAKPRLQEQSWDLNVRFLPLCDFIAEVTCMV